MNSLNNYIKGAMVFLVVCIFWLTPKVFAVEWAKTYGGYSHDQARDIKATKDGGYIVAGWTESVGAGGRDFLIIKLDSNGQVEWKKTYGGTGQERAYSIQQTSDGGYIVAGETSSFSSDNSYEIWILKLKKNGDIEWQKRYYQNIDYKSEGAYSIKQTPDGGYIVAGWIQSRKNTSHTDILVMKLSSSGSIEWQKDIGKKPNGTYTRDPFDDKAYSVELSKDGGYIIAAQSYIFAPGAIWRAVPWIIKLNSQGDVEWNREFSFLYLETNGRKMSIKQASDSGYICVIPVYVPGSEPDYSVIIKLSADGTYEWGKKYDGNKTDILVDIDRCDDNGYIVTGYSNSFSGGIATNIWLLKLSNNGAIQWQKQYGDAQHSAEGFAVQHIDSGYIVTGLSSSNDYVVLKVDANGNIPNCNLISSTNANVSDIEVSATSRSMQPWADSVTVGDSHATVKSPNLTITTRCHPTYSLKVAVNPQGGGTVTSANIHCPNVCSANVAEGNSVELVATANSGYRFLNWSGDCNNCTQSTCILTMDTDKNCIANFEISDKDEDGIYEDHDDDANGDGIPDYTQKDIVTPSGGKYAIGFSTPNQLISLHKDETPLTVKTSDGNLTFPYGTVSFAVQVSSPGDTAQITLFYPFNANIVGYAKKIGDSWIKVPDTHATVTQRPDINRTIITLHIADGSEYDSDGSKNGYVADPGGPYTTPSSSSSSSSTGGSSSSSGATNVTVPLSPSMLGLFAFGLLFLSLFYMSLRKEA